MMHFLKKCGVIIVTGIASVCSLIIAFVVGLQKSAFFAAISFLSFFLLGVISFHRMIVLIRGKEKP